MSATDKPIPECKQARSHDELIAELLDSRVPKTEREHAAAREIEALRAKVKRLWEIMRPKREKECLTLDDWRTRAYYLEANWSRCSRACAVEQIKRERAEARADKLAETLQLALDSHGKTLLTDPPQDAWKVNRVEEIGRALLREQKE